MKYLIWIFLLLSMTAVTGQEINQTDAQGRKQGEWVKRSPEGVLIYQGQFEGGQPVGVFKRYYDDGMLQAEMHYRTPEEVYAKLYYQGRTPVLMAEGKYINQKKDSVWLTYDTAGRLKALDTYVDDERSGRSLVYHENGAVSEETTYVDGKRHGEWKQYYPDGTLMASGTFDHGKRIGEYLKNYPNGNMWVKGKYENGYKESTWIYGNENGAIGQMVVYRSGEEVKQVKRNGTFTEFYELNKPKLVENYKNGELHGAYIEYNDDGRWVEKQVDKRPEGGTIETYRVIEGQSIRKKANYRNGALHGKLMLFDEEGKLVEETEYENGVIQE